LHRGGRNGVPCALTDIPLGYYLLYFVIEPAVEEIKENGIKGIGFISHCDRLLGILYPNLPYRFSGDLGSRFLKTILKSVYYKDILFFFRVTHERL